MKKVKILFCEEVIQTKHSLKIISEGISNWEEISDEEYDVLYKNIRKLIPNKGRLIPILVMEDDSPMSIRIENVKKLIGENNLAKEAKEKNLTEKKIQENKAKLEREEKKLADKMAELRKMINEGKA